MFCCQFVNCNMNCISVDAFYTTHICSLLSISKNYSDTWDFVFIQEDNIKLRLVFCLPVLMVKGN